MENIKKLYINDNGTPIYTHYNGSWNVMKMETIDGLDYSYSISEMLDDSLYQYEEENGELNGDEYDQFIANELEYLADCCGWELVKADWFLKKESQLNYLQDEMMNTNCVLDYIFRKGEKPRFAKIWKEVSERDNSYTMEKIHEIIYDYNNKEQFDYIVSLGEKFNIKVEKMKENVESDDVEKLWDILSNNL